MPKSSLSPNHSPALVSMLANPGQLGEVGFPKHGMWEIHYPGGGLSTPN